MLPSYFRIDYRLTQRAAAVIDASLKSASEDDFTPTIAAINILMSSYAWKGDIPSSLDQLGAAIEIGILPNVDTFSYALESVGKGTKRAIDNKNASMDDVKRQSIVDENVKAADTILAYFEKAVDSEGKPLEPNHTFVRNYVEFLCLIGQIETATMVARDFLEQGKKNGMRLVDNKTLSRVSIANASVGNFETARCFLACMSESLPHIENKVDRLEMTPCV